MSFKVSDLISRVVRTGLRILSNEKELKGMEMRVAGREELILPGRPAEAEERDPPAPPLENICIYFSCTSLCF